VVPVARQRAVARRLVIVVAWVWLGESLDLPQLSGAAATLAGISPAQTPR
jgi:drug/metabolite transporter (DMT)-like permease